MALQQKAFTVRENNVRRKLVLLALVAATVSVGLTACQSTNEQTGTAPPPAKSEHPEHPK
jgi:hypothetical protein